MRTFFFWTNLIVISLLLLSAVMAFNDGKFEWVAIDLICIYLIYDRLKYSQRKN